MGKKKRHSIGGESPVGMDPVLRGEVCCRYSGASPRSKDPNSGPEKVHNEVPGLRGGEITVKTKIEIEGDGTA